MQWFKYFLFRIINAAMYILSYNSWLFFLAIGNPRGNENAFLLTMGIFWFRVHNWWANHLEEFYRMHNDPRNDEFLFNRARQFTIATYQVRLHAMHQFANTICILIFSASWVIGYIIQSCSVAHHLYWMVATVSGKQISRFWRWRTSTLSGDTRI